MPPAHKFTKEEIIAAALDLVRREGIAAVTARGLGAKLGVSSRPIFTAFRNMEEVHGEIVKAARALYNGYVEKGLANPPAFKSVGMQYFRFAKDEPKLFELLFMNPGHAAYTLEDILPAIDDNSDRILASVQQGYGLSTESAYKMYQALWIFTHGLACLSVSGMGQMSEEEASALLTEAFIGMLMKLKREESL